jgi:hypothetical protein
MREHPSNQDIQPTSHPFTLRETGLLFLQLFFSLDNLWKNSEFSHGWYTLLSGIKPIYSAQFIILTNIIWYLSQ